MSSQSWISAATPSIAGSPILRESPPFSSNTGPHGADLSLSELYISERESTDTQKPFSLLPQRHEEPGQREAGQHEEHSVFSDSEDQLREADDTTIPSKRPVNDARQREDRLQRDLFVLKRLNASFTSYNEALKNVRSCTRNVALQLDRTDQLLNQYVNLLQQTEKNSKLIFDKSWQGGSSDVETLEQLRRQDEERARREKEEQERRAREEEERRLMAEQEKKVKEMREAKQTNATLSLRGVRGARPTRGSDKGSISRGRTAPTTSRRGTLAEIPARGRGTRKV